MKHNEYQLKHRGRWVIDTSHALDRMDERDVELRNGSLRAMVDRVMGLKNYARLPYNTEFFVWFRSMQQGAIVAHRRDTKSGSKKLHFFVVTVYPKGKRPEQGRNKTITIK